MSRLRRNMQRLRLGVQRHRLVWRAYRQGARLRCVTRPVRGDGVLLFCVLRNERDRLPEFLDHYRQLSVSQFFMIDNESEDDSRNFLRHQPDVSLWQAPGSYREARFGMDWADALKNKFGRGRWCLTVDADELLVYPNHDTRPLPALTRWLDDRHRRSFSAVLLDLYPGPAGTGPQVDLGNYRAQRDPLFGHDWIQGGVRDRVYFSDAPGRSPALNKLPLVRWQRGMGYVSSTHHMLPRGLNRRCENTPTGVLLHTKLLADVSRKAATEVARGEHYRAAREYRALLERADAPLHHEGSTLFDGWRQLEDVGLMSRGVWA